jgi:hypothetical protein
MPSGANATYSAEAGSTLPKETTLCEPHLVDGGLAFKFDLLSDL